VHREWRSPAHVSFVRIEVDVETLVDELHAYVADSPAVRRKREYPVLRELGGPGTYLRLAPCCVLQGALIQMVEGK
jgi:hypothetical protein